MAENFPMQLREEEAADIPILRRLIERAFADLPHSLRNEGAIVDALRDADALRLSLVAEQNREILGHVAFSPVKFDEDLGGWFGLGPVAVRPDRQRRGIGRALIEEGLQRLQRAGAHGCVVVGDPAYYSRFGFVSDPTLHFEAVPAPYLMSLTFVPPAPSGKVVFHESFRTRP